MEEKLDKIIVLLTQLPDMLHSFITSKSEDESEQPKSDESEQPKPDETKNKEKDLGMDYLEF